VAPAADARITKIQVTSKESPTFGATRGPASGQYEKIVGTAYGEIDPLDPKNAVIVDIQLAHATPAATSSTRIDFYILKPIDLSKGAHR
jgi:hypothetical protein